MAGCCNATSKFVNYLFNTFLFLVGAAVMAFGIYLLVSDFSGFVAKWWIWVGVASGLLLIIVSFLGCWAAKNQNKCVLTLFWVLSGVLFAAFTVTAIGATVYFSYSDQLSELSAAQLNQVSGSQEDVYKNIRTAYGELWSTDKCSGATCDVTTGPTVSCTAITCNTKFVQDTFNTWIREGVSTAAAFAECHTLSVNANGIDGNSEAANGWCASQTAVLFDVRNYTLGLMIALWIVTAFMLVLVISNCVLVCGKKNRKGGVLATSTATTAQVVTVPQNTTTVHVIKV